jgi:hypothetical protein
MSKAAPILIKVKQWCEKKWVSMTSFKEVTLTDEVQKRRWISRGSSDYCNYLGTLGGGEGIRETRV